MIRAVAPRREFPCRGCGSKALEVTVAVIAGGLVGGVFGTGLPRRPAAFGGTLGHVLASLTFLLGLLATTATTIETRPSPPVDEAYVGAPDGVTPSSQSDPLLAVSWVAPPDCPGVAAFRTEIRRVAGAVPPSEESLIAGAIVQRRGERNWQVTLATRLGTRVGERMLVASDCEELMRAAALVVALMINPASLPVPDPPPKREAIAPVAVASAAPAPKARDLQLAAGMELLFGTGALPSAGPGFGLRVAVKQGAWSGEARGGIWAERAARSPSDVDAGGSFRLVDMGLAACASGWNERQISSALCAGATVARLHGTGYGVSAPGEASAWWSAGFVESSVRLRVTARQRLRVAAQALVSIGRPAFALQGVGPVFQPEWIWARGTIGWEVTF